MQICGPGSHDSCSSEKMDVLGQHIRNICLTPAYSIITWRDVKLRFIHISGSRILPTDQSNFLPTKRTGKTGRSVNKEYIYSQIAGSSWVTCLPKMQSYGNWRQKLRRWYPEKNKPNLWTSKTRQNIMELIQGYHLDSPCAGVEQRSVCWPNGSLLRLDVLGTSYGEAFTFLWFLLVVSYLLWHLETYYSLIDLQPQYVTAWMQVCR